MDCLYWMNGLDGWIGLDGLDFYNPFLKLMDCKWSVLTELEEIKLHKFIFF